MNEGRSKSGFLRSPDIYAYIYELGLTTDKDMVKSFCPHGGDPKRYNTYIIH